MGEAARQAATGPAIQIGSLEATPHVSGALHLVEERTLLVADLHLEKGSAMAARGVFLPPYDSRATLLALAGAIMAFAPRRVIALGDSFHDAGGSHRLDPADREALNAAASGRDWVWLLGNHDPAPPAGLPGESCASLTLGGVTLRHEPSAAAQGPEIAGHLHPAGKVRMRGRAVRRRCFAACQERIVMPAMGAYAGGLNVLDSAFSPLFGGGFEAWMIGDSRLFRISRGQLLPD